MLLLLEEFEDRIVIEKDDAKLVIEVWPIISCQSVLSWKCDTTSCKTETNNFQDLKICLKPSDRIYQLLWAIAIILDISSVYFALAIVEVFDLGK